MVGRSLESPVSKPSDVVAPEDTVVLGEDYRERLREEAERPATKVTGEKAREKRPPHPREDVWLT